MQENIYGVSDRLKAFVAFFSSSLIIALIGLFIVPFVSLPADSFASKMYNKCCSTNYLFYLTPLLILTAIIFGTVLIITVFSKKIIVTDDAIILKNAFKTRKLAFDEIKGFTVAYFSVYIKTNSKDKKRLSISLLSLNRADNLIQNLEKHFVNLDF